MKKQVLPMACLGAAVLLLSSCLKDQCTRTYRIVTPVYAKLSAVRAQVRSTSPSALGTAGKLFIRGNRIFLNEPNRGIHIIDVSNRSHPVKTGFINIPGNADLAVRDNILYADMFCDLLAMDISDPAHANVTKYLTNTFPERAISYNSSNPDSIEVIASWSERDTIMPCSAGITVDNNCPNCGLAYFSASASAPAASTKSLAGSMARFATNGAYMYTVGSNALRVISIGQPANPVFLKSMNIGWNIETIFPYNNKLYIGAGSSMSVFDLQDPANPTQLSWSGHWCSGDPVVADDNYAYVTLHEANVCRSTVNQLEVYDLRTPQSPALVKVYPLSNPQGLSKDGNLLFICDGSDGLKVFDAADPRNIRLIKRLSITGTYDVVAADGVAYLVAKDGLFLFDYHNPDNIQRLGTLLKD